MTGADSQPDWNLLPHDPQTFFELDDGYGRKDLKRRYNRLLKRFKPEKYPQQFQRIREAYEQLDNQLRYGSRLSEPTPAFQQYQWDIDAASESFQSGDKADDTRSHRRESAETKAGVHPLHERLATESVAELYAEIASLEEKTPYHYFALALLSDGLEPPAPEKFVKWLLAGLKRCPHDPALFRLLYAYVRGPVVDKELVGLLRAVSQVIRDDRFYFLTEPLWDRLLKSVSSETFQRLLARCETNLSDYQLVRKLTFYVHILKNAMWSADREWTAKAFGLLEENYQEIPPFLEYDVELLFQLREYREQREKFLSGHPLRRLLDRTIELYCTGDSLEAERAFVGCQVNLTVAGRDLLDAFPVLDETSADFEFMTLWHMLNGEFSERVAETEEEANRRPLRIRPVLFELESRTDRTSLGQFWNWSGWFYAVGRFVIYLILYALSYASVVDGFGLSGGAKLAWMAASFAIAGVGGWAFNRYVAERMWEAWCVRMGKKCYDSIWRKELHRFMSRTFVPYNRLLQRIERVKDPDGQLTCRLWIVGFSSRDPALMIYSYAQRFVA